MKSFTVILCVILLAAPQIYGICNYSDIDADKLCEEKGSPGTMALECDETCNKFVICFSMASKLQGLIKVCPTGKYYNRSTNYCSSQKAEYCA